MRIVAGAWRGRTLVAPPGSSTRPTADRVRQALFDMLMHAEWGGRGAIEGAHVLDVFAGTGALGLEALSRGAASACFIENDAAALKALRANVAACRAESRVEIVAEDVTMIAAPSYAQRSSNSWGEPGRDDKSGSRAGLVFLDPPYGQDLVPRAIARLKKMERIAPGALIIAETGRAEMWMPDEPLLAERQHGAARIVAFRGI